MTTTRKRAARANGKANGAKPATRRKRAAPEPSNGYTAASIQVLEGLEAVRRRPGMYIGSTDQRGLHHLIYEIVDNAIDEAMAGFCDLIEVTIEPDGHVAVTDNGRGIPDRPASRSSRPSALRCCDGPHDAACRRQVLARATTTRYSGGLHGVGASVVNALSSRNWRRLRRRATAPPSARDTGLRARANRAAELKRVPKAKLPKRSGSEHHASLPDSEDILRRFPHYDFDGSSPHACSRPRPTSTKRT